jgi:HEAT repeat protein
MGTLRSLVEDPFAPVRLASAASAASLGGPGAVGVLDVATRDGDVRVRLEAVHGLRTVGTAPARARLRELASSEAGPVQTAAIEEIAALRDSEAIPLLERLLDSSQEPVRVAAREAIFAIRSGPPADSR